MPVNPLHAYEVADGADAGNAALTPAAAAAAFGRLTAEAIPRSRRLWMIGDSNSDNGNPGAAFGVGRLDGIQRFTGLSIIGATHANLDGRVRVGGVAATGGYTAEQILATHVPTIVSHADPGDIVIVLAGTNNMAGGDVAATRTALSGIYSALEGAGLVVIPCTLPPNKKPADYVAFTQAINFWVQDNGASMGRSVSDLHGVLVESSLGELKTAYDSGDHTHLSAAGAWAAGAEIARAITARVPAAALGGLSVTSANPSALFNTTNGVLLTDTNSDGIPDGWTLMAPAGTSTFVLSTDAAFAGQKLTMTRGDADALLMSGTFTLVPGNRVLVGLKFRFTAAASGTWSFRLENVAGSGPMLGYEDIPVSSPTGVSTVIWDFIVPSGWPTYIFRADLYCQVGAASALEVGQVTVRDLTAEGAA